MKASPDPLTLRFSSVPALAVAIGWLAGCNLILPFDRAPAGDGRADTAADGSTVDIPRGEAGAADLADGPVADGPGADLPQPLVATVQRGSCSIAATAQAATGCTLPVPLKDRSRTFMVFQASSTSANPHSSLVRCHLADTQTISCDRFGKEGAVNIAWQTVELAGGAAVQHLTPVCNEDGDADEDITLVKISPVDVTRTFLLLSHRQAGVAIDGNDRRTARLIDPTTVELRQTGFLTCAAGGSESALQVVELAHASVTRGATGAMSSTSLSVTGLPAVDTTRTLLLYTYRTYSVVLAEGLVRGRITGPSSLEFTRQAATTQDIDDIAWERIELSGGVSVQQVDVKATAGQGTATAPVPQPVDPTRSIALSGGQWTAGQGVGETDHATDDALGVALGRHTLTSATTLSVTRDASAGLALWTSYVVEF